MAGRKKPVVADGIPDGLRSKGVDLWQRLTAEYDFMVVSEKLLIPEEAARTADMVDRLQAIIDGGDDLRVRGSQGQPVVMPEKAEARQWRSQLAQLLDKLRLPEEKSEGATTHSQLGRHAARTRWSNRTGG